MGLNANTSSALQRLINPTYETSETLYQNEYDVHCPSAVTPGLNAKSLSCVFRLTNEDIPRSCRVCEQGKKVLAKVNPGAIIDSSRCSCGAKTAKDDTKCLSCRKKAVEYYKTRTADRVARFCKICGKVEMKGAGKFCKVCLPIREAELYEKKKLKNKKDRLMARKKKVEAELKKLTEEVV